MFDEAFTVVTVASGAGAAGCGVEVGTGAAGVAATFEDPFLKLSVICCTLFLNSGAMLTMCDRLNSLNRSKALSKRSTPTSFNCT